jgi:hypothetical protein
MADRTYHELTRHTLRRTELGSVNADFLHRASGAASFLRALLNSRGEERFTPVLHGHFIDHFTGARRAKPDKLIRWTSQRRSDCARAGTLVRAGATPPFDARCVTVPVWSLPPSQELRIRVLRGCTHRPENLSDRMADIL